MTTPLEGSPNMVDPDAPDTSGVVHNPGELRELVRGSMDELDRLADQVADINAKKKEIRRRLKDRGIALKAFDVVYGRRKLADQRARDEFDWALDFCLEAANAQRALDFGEAKH